NSSSVMTQAASTPAAPVITRSRARARLAPSGRGAPARSGAGRGCIETTLTVVWPITPSPQPGLWTCLGQGPCAATSCGARARRAHDHTGARPGALGSGRRPRPARTRTPTGVPPRSGSRPAELTKAPGATRAPGAPRAVSAEPGLQLRDDLVDADRALLAGLHVLELDDALGQVALAQHQGVAGAGAVGGL